MQISLSGVQEKIIYMYVGMILSVSQSASSVP